MAMLGSGVIEGVLSLANYWQGTTRWSGPYVSRGRAAPLGGNGLTVISTREYSGMI